MMSSEQWTTTALLRMSRWRLVSSMTWRERFVSWKCDPSSGHCGLPSISILQGLRSIRVEAFPFLVFFLIRGEYLDVLRVLQSSRGVPTTLRGS